MSGNMALSPDGSNQTLGTAQRPMNASITRRAKIGAANKWSPAKWRLTLSWASRLQQSRALDEMVLLFFLIIIFWYILQLEIWYIYCDITERERRGADVYY